MAVPIFSCGSTTMAKVRNAAELGQVLADPWLDCETIIIKPNWVSTDPADFTDAATLRLFLEALSSQVFIVESYSLLRAMNILRNGMAFIVGDNEVDWQWLLKGKGWNWLIEQPDWEWFKSGGHWDQLRQEEKVFLDRYGFTDLFEEYGVTYINVTEEVWCGRTADPRAIRRSVEARFKPVQSEVFYEMVPSKLYDRRGSTFISLAKLKVYASFTMKNLFGMIPDPLRPRWHGAGGCKIAESIVDINKIYQSLFNVLGICEALSTTAYVDPEGELQGVYTGKYNVTEGSGMIAFSRDLVSLDTTLLALSDPSTRLIVDSVNRAPITLAEQEFGAADKTSNEETKLKVGHWFSPGSWIGEVAR